MLGAAVIGFVLAVWYMDGEITDSDLITEYYKFNNLCRDGNPDANDTWRACERRDIFSTELTARGYCFGTVDQAEYEKSWHTCN